MIRVVIHHDSVTGNLHRKALLVKTAIYDPGFELFKVRWPALKLYPATAGLHPYFVLGLEKSTIDNAVAQINSELYKELLIPHTAFDRSSITDDKVVLDMKLHKYMELLPVKEYVWSTFAFSYFSVAEKKAMLKKNYSCFWNKNHNKIVSLWAQTMPTYDKPVNISKRQYFEKIFENSHPHFYRRPFFDWV